MDDYADLIENEDSDEGGKPSYFKPEVRGITRRKVRSLYKPQGGAHSTRDWNFLGMSALPSEITFTRAQPTATRVNPSGLIEPVAADTPRFDYDPITKNPRGLLVEQTSINVLLRSIELNNGSWTKAGGLTVGTDAAISPDGTQDAEKLIEAVGPTVYAITQSVAKAASALPYTFSVYLKAAERGFGRIIVGNTALAAYFSTYVNLTTGALSNSSGVGFTATSAVAYDAGNGWWRVAVTATTDTDTVVNGTIRIAQAAGTDNYTGDGTSGIYAWGAQLEQQALASSLIPTVSTSLQRNADGARISGANFTNFWNPAEGTLYVESYFQTDVAFTLSPYLMCADNTINDFIALAIGGSNRPTMFGRNGGVTDGSLQTTNPYTAGAVFKHAGRYRLNDYIVACNGQISAPDNTVLVPTVNALNIGSRFAVPNLLSNGWIRRAMYWNTGKDDAFVQRVTQ